MRVLLSGVVAACVLLFAAPSALGTTAFEMTYSPPLVFLDDPADVDTLEDVTITRAGSDFEIRNDPFIALTPESDPGCDWLMDGPGYACPVAGVEKFLINTRGANDVIRINLGASANRVRQIVKAGEGEDLLVGGKGRQRLEGGPENDVIRGGPGRDLLIGGPGKDTCRGGPGKDRLRSC